MINLFLRLAFFTALVVFPDTAFGQFHSYRARTAEYMTGSSDLVVRATIVDLEYRKYVPKTEGEKETAHLYKVADILLHVDRCLRGSTDSSIRLTERIVATNERLDDWRKGKTSVFWFLVQAKPDGNGITHFTYRQEDGGRTFSAVHPPEIARDKPPILLLDLDGWQPITSSEGLEENIMNYSRKQGATRDGGKSLPITRDIARQTNMYGVKNNELMVPTKFPTGEPKNSP